MSLTADPGPRGLRIDAGVIEDARAHHERRRRRYWAAVVLAVLIVAVAAYAALAGGSTARFAVPRPGAVTGSLQPLSASSYEIYATPGLFPGDTTLSIETQLASGGGGGSDLEVYPGSGVPIVPPGPLGHLQANTSPLAQDEVLVVAANVAAVRVGNLGTVGARSAPGLPAGDKVAAFRMPPTAHPKPLPAHNDRRAVLAYLQARANAPAVSLTPLSTAAGSR